MRSTCKSHTNDKWRKRRVLSDEKEQPSNQRTAKPTNVKTFAKKKDGGMIGQAQRNYRGSYISGEFRWSTS